MKNTKAESYAEYRSKYYMNLNMMMQKQIEGIIYTAMAQGLDPDPVVIQQGLQTVMDQGMAALSLVDRLTNYLNLIGGENLDEHLYDVRKMIEEIENENSLSRGVGLNMVFQSADEMPEKLFGDDMRIIYVVNGFLGNCYNRMHDGEVTVDFSVKMRSYASLLTIRITDNGEPLPEEFVRIIRKYVREGDLFSVDESARQGGDQGFAIIGYLLYQMNGKVHILRDEKEKKNVVIVEIPQLAG